ncbi:MAG: alpha/beta fold hydrolase [Saprospiraceae bacterium]|nr:alpha/beta fold hydrolase [Saprospiraceae bacterium]
MILHHKIQGQGDPLIILHGLFGSSDNWATLARRWAEHFTVVTVDLRNHGRSFHADAMNYPVMVEDVVRLMEQEWIHKAHILGHSMGGKVAMHLALSHPDLVDQLLIADIGVKDYPGGHENILDSLNALPVDQLTSRADAEEFLRRTIHQDGVIQFLLKNLARDRGNGFHWKMNLPVISDHYDRIITGVRSEQVYTGTTTFFRGGRSDYILDEDWPDILLRFPAAELKTIPDAGHWLHAEQPDLFYQAVLDILQAGN